MKFCPQFLFILLVFLALGCAAPHDNPLDPDSDHYHGPPASPPDLYGYARSVHISRLNFSDVYLINCGLAGSDTANVDTACAIYDGRTAVPLSTISWSAGFSAGYIGDAHLATALGTPFTFKAVMNSGDTLWVGPAYMWRVIEETPVLIAPMNEDTVGTHPVLEWQPFGVNYPFNYLITMIDDSGSVEWVSDTLPSSVLSVQTPTEIPKGYHSWTLLVVDNLYNSSRSKEGEFYVDTSQPNF